MKSPQSKLDLCGCGAQKTKESKRCKKCSGISKQRINRVEAKDLLEQGYTKGYIGRIFGVGRERARQIVGNGGVITRCFECGGPKRHNETKCLRCKNQLCVCGAIKSSYGILCTKCSGIKKRKHDYNKIISGWNAGKSVNEIATECSTTMGAINQLIIKLRRRGYKLEKRRQFGHYGYLQTFSITTNEVNNE